MLEVVKNLTSFHQERKEANDTFWLPLEDFSVDRFNDLANWLGVTHCKFVSIAANKGQRTKAKFNNPKHLRCWDKKWDKEVLSYFERVKAMRDKENFKVKAKQRGN